jgi:hypothetical protein
MKHPSLGLRPQDILILLKMISWRDRLWRQIDLALELDISQAEVAYALERLHVSGLVDASKKKVRRLAVVELLVHAIKYIFPPVLGSYVRGLPTARSAKPLVGKLVVDDELPIVWPSERGEHRGLSIEPIYHSVPFAALKDPLLYELLAIVDSLRAGNVRERKFAEEELRKRILKRQ